MTFFAHFHFDPKYLKLVVAMMGAFTVGSLLDRTETQRMIMFRDKSALYGREMAEGEKPSWP